MIDDPGEVLRAAGVECAEADEWFEYTSDDMSNPDVDHDRAEAAILALARIVADQAEQLKRLAPKGGPDYVPTSGGGVRGGGFIPYGHHDHLPGCDCEFCTEEEAT